MSPSSFSARKLVMKLSTFIAEKELGEIYFAPLDVYLSETDTYQPDIIFISKERLSIIGEKMIEGPPDLVIEVLSPATAYYDLRIKKDAYEKYGVKEYWIIDPLQKAIEVFVNREGGFEPLSAAKGDGEVRSEILTGLRTGVNDIF